MTSEMFDISNFMFVYLHVYYSDTLNVLHCGEIVAECIFLRKRVTTNFIQIGPTLCQFYFISSAMNCDVILTKHRKRPQNKEIPLPERSDQKLMLYELEVRQ